MPPESRSRRPFDPAPRRGLARSDFSLIADGGFGDPNNSYSHSMAWFAGRLFIGTSRANMCLLQQQNKNLTYSHPPVECLFPLNSPEFEGSQARAEIWRYDPSNGELLRIHQAPLIVDSQERTISRELSFRGMTVHEDARTGRPCLLVTTWARPYGVGPLILRSWDGETFETVCDFRQMGLVVNSIRALVPFKGRLFTAPSGTFNNNPNTSGVPVIYEAEGPEGPWRPANLPSFGEAGNVSILELCACGDWLYAGTFNFSGFQVWRTRAEGEAPYTDWECVIRDGAGRGPLNQIAMAMCPFGDALYVGSGIQNGGYDVARKIGPAGAEIIRIFPDGRWEVVVGDPRGEGRLASYSLSGLKSGFDDLCNGYLWKMAVHDGWLYAGTLNSAVYMQWTKTGVGATGGQLMEMLGVERIVQHQGGFDLWRSADGVNWLPVDRHGFGNIYNYGIRNLVPTPYGLFVGTANPFGPRIARRDEVGNWFYADNPRGGTELWLGRREEAGQ